MNPTDLQAHLQEVLKTILTKLEMDAVISIEPIENEDRHYMSVELQIEDRGSELIGRYGNTLESLTALLNAMMPSAEQEDQWRVIVDINDYRKERIEYIEGITEKAIAQVKSDEQPYNLSPMKAWERRIVHMVVTKYPELETTSEGEGIDRHVVIQIAN